MTARARRLSWLIAAAVASGPLAGGVAGQRPAPPPPDSSATALLDALVVTADRAATPLGASIGAVTRLDASALRVTAFAGVAEALGTVPGFTLVDRDGSGLDPQPIVRGFYGGGETEYLVVLLDGKPMNALHSGLMAWELAPPVAITAVEIVRGPASSLYGDAAVGGVVNLISGDDRAGGGRIRLLSAGHGLLRGGARFSGRLGGRSVRVHAAGLRTGGFRDHGDRAAGDVGASYDLASGEGRSLTLSLRSSWRSVQQPGPLATADLALDRTRSDAFYRFDETGERVLAVGVDGSVALGGGAVLSADVTSESRRSDDTRTLPLAPDFADTKERELGTDRIGGGVEIVWDDPPLPWDGRIVTGIDASWGRIDSEYYTVVAGGRAAYTPNAGGRDALDASGLGHRGMAAGFAQLEVWPVSAVRLSAGVRYDRVGDHFEPRAPSTGEPLDATSSAFSPKVGASVRWHGGTATGGGAYLTAGRTFKTATPDQLFDQRSIPLPFPPFSVTTSNPLLVPQRGRSLEAGAHQSFSSGSRAATATVSVSIYQLDMEDELDFDLATLRYVNIGESRHRGVESGLRFSGPGPTTGHVSYTLQSAVSRVGPTAGRALKAIPRHGWSAGLSRALATRVRASVDVTRASGAWLDDVNTLRLPAFTRLDAGLGADVAGATAFLEVRDVLDARYSTTGFPDPSGSGTIYYYPAAGRTLGVGISMGW